MKYNCFKNKKILNNKKMKFNKFNYKTMIY